ncbi:MAG: TerB family tellurite resistance protein [Flavobacteriales bacterium]|nr:TerB family tellurite resistance protein [Flavobacteriales bacterium]
MSISDLFDSGFKLRNKGHFSAIVRVAMTDGEINEKEKAFLDRLARSLEINEEEYQEILENPTKYPINPPYLYIKRVERLYDLGRMVYADEKLGERQEKLLKKFALRLGFTPGNVNYIVDKALTLIKEGADIEEFTFEIRNMNK